MFSLPILSAHLKEMLYSSFSGRNSHLFLFTSLVLLLSFIKMALPTIMLLSSLIKDLTLGILLFSILKEITLISSQLETLNKSLITYQRTEILRPEEISEITRSLLANLMHDGELLSRLQQLRRNILT
uniref:RepB n=1 Tax=Chickpea chlorotic dwarf virus TaxID=463360 RepID=W0GBJ5_9GEMI|nr:RepB [Chickpea chlorotic dwarf virus]